LSVANRSPQTAEEVAPDLSVQNSSHKAAGADRPLTRFSPLSWKAIGFIICGVILGYAVGSEWPWSQTKPTGKLTPEDLVAMPDSAVPLRPGPWGNLEALPMYIEPPDEYLPTESIEQDDPRWRFTGYTPDQLLALFKSADLNSEQRAELSDSSKWQQDQKAIYVSPSKELILALSPLARKTIYEPMMRDPGNKYNLLSRSFATSRFADFFADSGLPNDTLDLIRKLSFPYGKLTYFSDVQLVLDTLPEPAQKMRFLKTLLRTPTLLLRLHLTPDSDIDELEHYWAKAGQGLDLRPMLESLSKLPKGARLSLTALLPPLPSAQIYTFPYPSLKPEDQNKDCRWTSLNFFRDVPDDRFTDSAVVRQTLLTDYYPVLSDARFGDLVLLAKPNGDIIHIAVYIAADIVYTKNSGNFRDPYILMTVSDMLDHFASQIPEGQNLQVSVYRNKYY
jgi:hypothetical protein